jgi:uncharacterized protein
MSLDIEEKLELHAPADAVFKFLIDPERVVTCLPGAELSKVEDASTFLGNMKVKVGPVTVTYHGRVRLLEVDDAGRRVKMSGEGTEKGGAGTARMSMESFVEATETGSRVIVKSKVDLAGKIVQFGRGMVKGVAGQLFKQFGENVKALLETDARAAAGVADGAESAAGAGAGAAAPAEADAGAGAAAAAEPGAVVAPPRSLAPRKAEPVHVLPLIFRALFAPIARWFRRLFRRR